MNFIKTSHQLGKIEISFILLISIAIILVLLFAFYSNKSSSSNISSFDECKNAGYPIAESYPSQCTANGNTFISTE